MAESVNVIDPILGSKLDNYAYNNNTNLVAQGELTVTITLHEYRELISKVALRDADIETANQDKYKREAENLRLKEEISQLRAELFKYQKMLGENSVDTSEAVFE